MEQFDLQTLLKQLLKTRAYCALQLNNTEKNYASILRSINPLFGNSSIFSFSISKIGTYYMPLVNWTQDPYYGGRYGLIQDLYQIQKQIKEQTHSLPTTALKGEILAFDIFNTLIDGAAAVSSYGILDDYNCPPIDSWFYLYEPEGKGLLLLAWIPEPLVSYVNDGINVNPEECINWFKVWYPDIYAQIFQAMPHVFVSDIGNLPHFLQR